MENKREILITNDDSIEAKGIHLLASIMKKYGNVTVVAPSTPQSGKSASLSIGKTLTLKKISEEEGIRYFTLDGTPVDCVKAALNECYSAERLPDLVASGINHGSNCSAAALYSGTLGACVEGTLYGIPSFGFSINTHDASPDFSAIEQYSGIIINNILTHSISPGIYLNINFPHLPASQIKGIKVTRKGRGRWTKEFDILSREEGELQLLMKGEFLNQEEDTILGDHILMKQGWITIVPHTIDTTGYSETQRIEKLWNI